MRRITNTILAVLGVVVFCLLMVWFLPTLREPFYIIFQAIWQVFKAFFLGDTVKAVGLYIVLATIVTGSFYGVSIKTEKKIWNAVSIILDLVGFVVLLIKL